MIIRFTSVGRHSPSVTCNRTQRGSESVRHHNAATCHKKRNLDVLRAFAFLLADSPSDQGLYAAASCRVLSPDSRSNYVDRIEASILVTRLARIGLCIQPLCFWGCGGADTRIFIRPCHQWAAIRDNGIRPPGNCIYEYRTSRDDRSGGWYSGATRGGAESNGRLVLSRPTFACVRWADLSWIFAKLGRFSKASARIRTLAIGFGQSSSYSHCDVISKLLIPLRRG
jgi:hypothetical protein